LGKTFLDSLLLSRLLAVEERMADQEKESHDQGEEAERQELEEKMVSRVVSCSLRSCLPGPLIQLGFHGN
jgi:hypothetical protein